MKKKLSTLYLTLLISIMLLATGCKEDCMHNWLNPVFIGYTENEIDSFIMRAYEPDGNFDRLVDTVVVSKSNGSASIYTTHGDSITVYMNYNGRKNVLTTEYDWQISIPSSNKTISISRIASPQSEGSRLGNCWNEIRSFLQNDSLVKPVFVQTDVFQTTGYMIYIHK